MNYLKIIAITLLFISCKKQTIIYKYKDQVIKRVDFDSKSVFYNISSGNSEAKIWAEYSGINDGFSGFLEFGKNNRVTILVGDGYFQKENLDTTFFNYKYVLYHEKSKGGKNVCVINSILNREKIENNRDDTEIDVLYNE